MNKPKLRRASTIGVCILLTAPNMASAQEATEAAYTSSANLRAMTTQELSALSLEQLLNTKITIASKTEEKLSDAPGVISVVTHDELSRFGGTTLADILDRVAGLNISTTYFTDRSTIAVRGDQLRIDSGHVLFLINGRPVREVLQGGISSELLETFPINIIERIEVIKGPGSVLYGSNAYSGVINIITQTPQETHAHITAMGGNPHDKVYGGSADVTAKIGGLGLVAAARYLKKADWKLNYHTDPLFSLVPEQPLTIPNYGGGAYAELTGGGLRLMSSFDQWQSTSFILGAFFGKITWKKWFGDLGYALQVTDQWKTDFHLTYTYATLDDSDIPNNHRRSHDVVAEWTNTLKLRDDLGLVFGVLYNYIKGKEWCTPEATDPYTDSKGSRPSYAAYGQVDYTIGYGVKLIGGFQAIKVNNLKLDFVPRLGAIWNPNKHLNLKALYSEAYRAPSINEVSINYPGGLQGDPNLKPEKVQSVDVSLSTLWENVSASISYFYTKHRDAILIIFDPPGFMKAYGNVGTYVIQGGELEAKFYATKEVFLTGSVLYQVSKDGDGNKNVTPIPSFGGKAGVSYKADNGLSASAFYVYQGELASKYNLSVNPKPVPYHMINLHGEADVAKLANLSAIQSLSLFLQVDNLLNKAIYRPTWGGNSGESIPFIKGRAIYLGISGGI
jgi:outer membrane receptor for ferrienterochelin and colicins